jgi:arylformamidase
MAKVLAKPRDQHKVPHRAKDEADREPDDAVKESSAKNPHDIPPNWAIEPRRAHLHVGTPPAPAMAGGGRSLAALDFPRRPKPPREIKGRVMDYEAEYNNRARVPEHPAIIAGWSGDAAAYRAARPDATLGIAYGARERERFDWFPARAPVPGLAPAVFFHGGYWQAFDGGAFSHMARGLNERGIDVAIVTYDLAPHVTLAALVEQARAATLAVARHADRAVMVFGHSAGGHLTATTLATDWAARGVARPTTAGLAISGLFDLVPLVGTSVNVKLGLDLAEAARLSPVAWPAPAGRRLVAAVGGLESSEYLRQNQAIVDAWRCSLAATGEILASHNHFSVIASLTDVDGALTEHAARLIMEPVS